jgi:hypothetical protein
MNKFTDKVKENLENCQKTKENAIIGMMALNDVHKALTERQKEELESYFVFLLDVIAEAGASK